MRERKAVVMGGMDQFQTRRGLGRVLGGLAALGAMGIAGHGEPAAGKKRKRARTGAQGPVGPSGPAGPTGPAGTPGTFTSVTAEASLTLGAGAGSQVESVADCGEGSVPLSCGWSYSDESAALDRTITQVQPGSFRGSGRCSVTLRRTANVGAAGGRVTATAICSSR